jgi:hypothetical protein
MPPLDEDTMSEEIEALSESIEEARAALSATRVAPPRPLVLTALAGYLWGSIATADTLLVVVRSGVGRGAGSLKRLIHEAYLDTLFLVSDPEPEFQAAKSYLSGYRDSRKLHGEYQQVILDHPDSGFPPVPEGWKQFGEPIEPVLDRFDKENSSIGGSKGLYARAWKAIESTRQWHWSGHSRKQMIDVLIERGKLDGPSAFMALSLTRLYNSVAHATAPWAELPPTPDGSTSPPPLLSPTQEIDQLALSGRTFLGATSREVRSYFEALQLK